METVNKNRYRLTKLDSKPMQTLAKATKKALKKRGGKKGKSSKMTMPKMPMMPMRGKGY